MPVCVQLQRQAALHGYPTARNSCPHSQVQVPTDCETQKIVVNSLHSRWRLGPHFFQKSWPKYRSHTALRASYSACFFHPAKLRLTHRPDKNLRETVSKKSFVLFHPHKSLLRSDLFVSVLCFGFLLTVRHKLVPSGK